MHQELKKVQKALKAKRHVIVGHNLFMDLMFVYATFIGRLPSRVEEFQEKIHKLFPLVIDTKYLATHGAESMNSVARATLKDLWEPFTKIHKPLIVLHEQHGAYGTTHGKQHQAGFDSKQNSFRFFTFC
jgi:poly(A)-specific ribonuclease